jgi:DNA-directed RNA polymerase, subunit E''''
MSNYYCLNCGSLVPEGNKFCPVCGDPVIGNNKLQTTNINFPAEPAADTIDFIPVDEKDTAQISKPQETAKTISVEKPKRQAAPEPVKEKKQSFFSRIFFEEVEISEEEAAAIEAKKNKKNGHHSHALPIVLVVILAVLLGAVGYLYLEKPAVLNSGLNKIGLGLPGYSTAASETASSTASASAAATDAATAAPTASAAATAKSKYIGSLTVSLESINIRDIASTSGNAVGKATQGTKYNVLATSSGEGYTWYEIGQDQWIADSNGEWVAYTAN